MVPMRMAQALTLTEEQRTTLTRVPRRRDQRVRIALRAAEGMLNQKIARELDTDVNTVGRWPRRSRSTNRGCGASGPLVASSPLLGAQGKGYPLVVGEGSAGYRKLPSRPERQTIK